MSVPPYTGHNTPGNLFNSDLWPTMQQSSWGIDPQTTLYREVERTNQVVNPLFSMDLMATPV